MATRGWEHATPLDTRHRRPLARLPVKARSKFGAVKTTVDGLTFASKAEARRYGQLSTLHRLGLIVDLELQPVYPLIVAGVQVGKYLADFRYYRADGELVVEDVKGMAGLPLYRLKRRIVEALYGITITEIR